MALKDSSGKVPSSDFILDEHIETSTETIAKLNNVNPKELCSFVKFDCVMKSVKNLDVKLCYTKSDIDPNKVSDVSFLLYQSKDFKTFLKFVHTIKSPVIVDCAKILGLPKVSVIFGLNFKTNMPGLNLNPSDMLVLNKFVNSRYINKHVQTIVRSFYNFIDFFGDNVIEAKCPVIFLKNNPTTANFGFKLGGQICFVVHCKK